MDFPEIMTSGFSFDEAITMTELCRRVYKVFENPQYDVKELYHAMYKGDEWLFIHSMSDYDTDGRLLILKRKKKNQFAIVFRGTIFTSTGFEFTGELGNEDIRLAKYRIIAGEPTPPSHNARVYAGMQTGFEALRDELELFFDVLLGYELKEKQIVDLINAGEEEQPSRIRTIDVALCWRRTAFDLGNQKNVFFSDIKKYINEKKIEKVIKLIYTESRKNIFDKYSLQDFSVNNVFQYDNNRIELYITGHSRGAALATFAVLRLKRYFESKEKHPAVSLKMYNIGSTKIGNKAFVEYYNEQMKGFSYRVQNLMDPATYYPFTTSIPFPYNLQLMIPGVNYVREGDLYYAYYEHVGEVYSLFGAGDQKLDLDFGGPLKFTIPVPFPHGPDGYKRMLIESREFERRLLDRIGNLFTLNHALQKQAFNRLDYQQRAMMHSLSHILDYVKEVDQKITNRDVDSGTIATSASQEETGDEPAKSSSPSAS